MVIVFIFISIYLFFFTRISFFKYDNFLFDDFDLAHHAQEIWNVLHGSLDCSILGLKFLGNHVHIIEFLVAPVYALFPHPKTLLFLQSLFLALGAWPLYLIAKRNLDKKMAIVIASVYLIYPALGYVNLFEFHPQALAVFFILFTFYFFERENMSAFLIFMFLSLICQENISLIIIMFGFYALIIRKKIRWVSIPIAVGIIWFLLCVLVVLPYFNKGEVGFYNIYGHLGKNIGEIGINILLHPIKVIRYLLSTQNAIYIFQLLAPVAFLPLLSRGILLFFIPSLLQHLLSSRLSEHTIYYQYTIEIIPFIFIGMIYGLRRFLQPKILNGHKEKIAVVIVILSLLFNVFLGPHLSLFSVKTNFNLKNLTKERERLVSLIPPNGSVVATFDFLSHLAHREKLYSFHHLYIGKHTLSSKDYVLPDDVEYALVNFSDPLTFQGFYRPNGDIRVRKFLEEKGWGAIEAVENIILFKRNYNSSFKPYRVIKEETTPANSLTLENNEIEFFNYSAQLSNLNGREYIRVKLNYKCLKLIAKNYWLDIQIMNQNNQVAYNSIHPIAYGIYPTYRWEKGQVIEEVFSIPRSEIIREGNYKVIISIFDFLTSQIEIIRNKQNCFQVGEVQIGQNKIAQ